MGQFTAIRVPTSSSVFADQHGIYVDGSSIITRAFPASYRSSTSANDC